MLRRALVAQKDTYVGGTPLRVFLFAVKTNLILSTLKLSEYLVFR